MLLYPTPVSDDSELQMKSNDKMLSYINVFEDIGH